MGGNFFAISVILQGLEYETHGGLRLFASAFAIPQHAHTACVPFICGISMASKDGGFLDFSFSLLRFFDEHHFSRGI